MEDEDEFQDMKSSRGSAALKAAGVAAVVPFVAHVRVNGLDYVKLAGGVLACVLVIAAGVRFSKEQKQLRSSLGPALLIFLAGAYHLATSGVLR